MDGNNDTGAENQATPAQEQEESTAPLTTASFSAQFAAKFKLSTPRKENMKKAIEALMTPVKYFKPIGDETVKALVARIRLDRARTEKEIAQLAAESPALRKGLAHVAEDQQRVDEVTLRGLEYLYEKPETQTPLKDPGEITTDWLRRFRKEVEGLGDDEMIKEAFSRVLAGEIEQPGSFSTQALRVLGTLDQKTAASFRTAASIALLDRQNGTILHALLPGPRPISLGDNGLQELGLDYDTLNILSENGLLTGNYREALYLSSGVAVLECQGKQWIIGLETPDQVKKRPLGGALFTTAGKELMRIVDIEEHPEFLKRLQDALKSQTPPLKMTLIQNSL